MRLLLPIGKTGSGSSASKSKPPSYEELLPHAELLQRLDGLADSVMLDTGRAALVLGISVNTLNHWRSDGLPPPFVKLGRGRVSLVRYRLGELRKYLAGNTFTDTAHALDAAARLIAIGPGGLGFDAYFDIVGSSGGSAVESDGAVPVPPAIGDQGKPAGEGRRPTKTKRPAESAEPKRDYMLDAVAPFWTCPPFVLDTALSKRADFLEHLLSERVKVEWMTWRKALGRLWLEKSVWERRMRAARVNRAGPDLAEVIHEHERLIVREGVPDDRTAIIEYLGMRPREGVEPDNPEVTSYLP